MKKHTKIITLILSALLLIGCAIGISVSAEEATPTVSIAFKNIAYEGAVKVLYAVEAQNVPDGAKVQMAFFDTMPASVDETPLYVKDEHNETIVINGVEYKAFFSEGIAPKNMRKSIYAVPVITNGETVLAYGDPAAYSVYTYGVNMLSKAPTEEQKDLYTALLDYGASVQKLLLGTDDYTAEDLEAAGGYADEYCGIKVSTTVDNVIVEEGEFLGYFAPETAVELTAKLYYDGAMFTGFTNTDREIVGDYAYATTAYTSEPGIAGFYKTYKSNFSVNNYTEGYVSTGTLYTNANSKYYTNNYNVGKTANNAIVNYGTEEAPNYALEHTHADGAESGSINYIFGTVGNAYIFETDLCFGGVSGAGTDNWQARLGFVSNATTGRSSEKNYTGYTFMYAKDGEAMTINGATLPVDEWVRFRFEYIPLGFYRGAYHGVMHIYKNGVFVTSLNQITDVDNSDCLKFQIGTRSSGEAGGWSMKIDNTVCYTVSEDYYGKGLYKNLADTYDSDKTYTNATVVEELNGNKVLSFVNKDGKSPSLTFKTDTVMLGETYVFDTDIMWDEMPLDEYNRAWICRYGFMSEFTQSYGEDDKYVRSNGLSATPANGALLNGLSSSGSISQDTLKDAYKLNPGTWYNLRVEYTPLGADADGYYSGTQRVYLNGVLIREDTNPKKETMMTKYQADRGVIKNNVGLVGFAFSCLSLTSSSTKFDNTYIGVIGEYDGYRMNDFANTVNKNSSYPFITLKDATDCVSEQTVVATPLATEAKSATNNVLKIVTDNTSSTQCENTISPSKTGVTAAAHGVYELEFDILFDPNSTLPATNNIFQQFVLHSDGGYVQLYRLTHTGDGIVKFTAEIGGSGGGKGGNIGSATLLDGSWHNVRIVYYKNGTNSALAVYVDNTLVGIKENIYYMTESAVTKSSPITNITWRIKPYAPSDEATSATYYFDNIGFRYAGPVPATIPGT